VLHQGNVLEARSGQGAVEEVAAGDDAHAGCVGGDDGVAQSRQLGVSVDGAMHVVFI